jgi:orotidine-5'-phosphate decarboxylase
VFVPLDTADADAARELARRLSGRVGGFKIGLELYLSHGPSIVRELAGFGRIFVDLKLHDIPNTVAGAAAALSRLGVSYFTIHALGGPAMIRRGIEAAGGAAAARGVEAPQALAVTVLTSHDDDALRAIGITGPCSAAVERLAQLGAEAGARGFVCSAEEVARLRQAHPRATLVVPGVRPASLAVSNDDQARIATPAEALRRGADLLVIGRPITQAESPERAAEAIAREIEEAGA